jgi:hypothetical protein
VGACAGLAHVRRRDGGRVTGDYLTSGTREIDAGGELHAVTVHLRGHTTRTSAVSSGER